MYKLCEALKVFGDVIDSCEAQAKVKSIAYRQQGVCVHECVPLCVCVCVCVCVSL